MNIEKIFRAISNEPNQTSLIIAVIELEAQGYQVTINNRHYGSDALSSLDESGELNLICQKNGVLITVEKDGQSQTFRLQFLDIDSICFTPADSPPVIFDPESTIGFYKSGKTN